MILRVITLSAALLTCAAVAPAFAAPTSAQDQGSTSAEIILVTSQDAYREAAKAARPGDTIVLENGVWLDFDMVIDARGTADAPITVRAQTPGQVILSGQSSLRLAGEYVVVSGLVFRDGYTPRGEVIAFRRDSKTLANHSRVTETVIENYSNPDRAHTDIWVNLYGKNNTFDHNHLAGKLNSGPTMAVRLNTEDSQNNNHLIANNYFGPRPVFGSNGGESLRIGTSEFSLTRSGTRVIDNYFDRCNGEVEIISNKSGGNIYRGNTFFRSRGALTLRHGSDTLVEGNLFDGDGAAYTGGVRVINARQTVRNNRFVDLTGTRFAAGLVIMNGVPNSPINRYHQVDSAVIENNTFENVARIGLGEGSDDERSALPINSAFRNNLLIGGETETKFDIYDDISGIAFSGNLADFAAPEAIASGFAQLDARAAAPSGVGASGRAGVAREDTGVAWYPKPPIDSPFVGGEMIKVEPAPNALSTAMAAANAGDTLVLSPGRYPEAQLLNLQIPLSIVASDTAREADRPVIVFERPSFVLLSGQGALRMRGITVSGEAAPDAAGNSFVSTTAMGGAGNHTVEFDDMIFGNFDVNRGFSVVAAAKGTFYDHIGVTRSQFTDVSGAVIKLDAETDDYGIYSAEYVVIEDSSFANIGGPVASVYRGGRDESTFGPHVWVRNSRFDRVGGAGDPLMRLHGVQNVEITGCTIANARPAELAIHVGNPKVKVSGNSVGGDANASALNTVDFR